MSVVVQLAEQITTLLNMSGTPWETKLDALSVASILLREERHAARAAAAEVEEELGEPVADTAESPGVCR